MDSIAQVTEDGSVQPNTRKGRPRNPLVQEHAEMLALDPSRASRSAKWNVHLAIETVYAARAAGLTDENFDMSLVGPNLLATIGWLGKFSGPAKVYIEHLTRYRRAGFGVNVMKRWVATTKKNFWNVWLDGVDEDVNLQRLDAYLMETKPEVRDGRRRDGREGTVWSRPKTRIFALGAGDGPVGGVTEGDRVEIDLAWSRLTVLMAA